MINAVVVSPATSRSKTHNSESKEEKKLFAREDLKFLLKKISVCNNIEKMAEHGIQSAILLYQRCYRYVTIATKTSH